MPPAKKTRPKRTPSGSLLGVAREFLEAVFAASTPGKIVIARAERGEWRPGKRFVSPVDAARYAIDTAAEGADVYFGVGRNVGPGRRADDVEELTIAWADLDCPGDSDAERTRLYDLVDQCDPAPSVVVKSASGFQCIWLLREPSEPKVVGRVNRALCAKLGADPHMHVTADAVLRVPGTLGYRSHGNSYDPPRAIQVVRLSPNLRYDVADLQQQLRLPRRFAKAGTKAGTKTKCTTAALCRSRSKPTLQSARMLAAAERHLSHSSRKQDGRLVICCPFHDDQHESAVIFVNGWFHCSGCDISEPAHRWTRRPEVRSWAGTFASRPGRERLLPEGFVKLPRLALRNAAAVLSPFPDLEARARRGDGWAWITRRGVPIGMGTPQGVARHVRRHGGVLVLRVWWACVALAQDPDAAIGRGERIKPLSRRGSREAMSKEELAVSREALIESAVRGRPPDPEKLAGQDLLRIIAAPNRRLDVFDEEGVRQPELEIRHDGLWNTVQERLVAPYAIVSRTRYYEDAIDRRHDAVVVEEVRHVDQTHGRFVVSVGTIGRLLGLNTKSGKVQTKTRRAIRKSLSVLRGLRLISRLSGKTKGWFDASLVSIIGKNKKGFVCCLHPGILLQIRRGPAWAPWDPRALHLRDEETLATYLELVWTLADAKASKLDIPLEKAATRGGVWNTARMKKTRMEYLRVWEKRIEEVRKLGLLDVTVRDQESRGVVLRVQAKGPLGRALRALAGTPKRRRPGG